MIAVAGMIAVAAVAAGLALSAGKRCARSPRRQMQSGDEGQWAVLALARSAVPTSRLERALSDATGRSAKRPPGARPTRTTRAR
jgi:hypothetical protein